MPIDINESEEIFDTPVASHNSVLPNWEFHQMKGSGMSGMSGVVIYEKGRTRVSEWEKIVFV